MKDAKFSISKALPNANANNSTAALDLGIESPGLSATWRRAHVEVAVPALSDHTNTSVNNTLTLQDSSDNSNFANTQPLVQVVVAGVASTGSVAATVKVGLPPATRRYIKFLQLVPTNGGIGNNATVNYDLVV